MKKTVKIGERFYLLPFRAHGLWVSDARDNSVCECINHEIAKDLAKTLNEKHGA